MSPTRVTRSRAARKTRENGVKVADKPATMPAPVIRDSFNYAFRAETESSTDRFSLMADSRGRFLFFPLGFAGRSPAGSAALNNAINTFLAAARGFRVSSASSGSDKRN